MIPLLLLGAAGAAGFALLASKQKRLPDGQNPFDAFPPGIDGSDPVAREVVTASSKRSYVVTSFTSADGRIYYVAERKGDVDWVSYFFDPTTSMRTLWAANADKDEDISAMKLDFNLVTK
jgi:hypothetical protein